MLLSGLDSEYGMTEPAEFVSLEEADINAIKSTLPKAKHLKFKAAVAHAVAEEERAAATSHPTPNGHSSPSDEEVHRLQAELKDALLEVGRLREELNDAKPPPLPGDAQGYPPMPPTSSAEESAGLREELARANMRVSELRLDNKELMRENDENRELVQQLTSKFESLHHTDSNGTPVVTAVPVEGLPTEMGGGGGGGGGGHAGFGGSIGGGFGGNFAQGNLSADQFGMHAAEMPPTTTQSLFDLDARDPHSLKLGVGIALVTTGSSRSNRSTTHVRKEEVCKSWFGRDPDPDYGTKGAAAAAAAVAAAAPASDMERVFGVVQPEPDTIVEMASDETARKELETWGFDPLNLGAMVCGWTVMHKACREGRPDVAAWLVFHGAGDTLHMLDQNGSTPLLWACYEGHEMTARWAISEGADVRAKNSKGATVLASAVTSSTSLGFLQFLVQCGAREDLFVADTVLHETPMCCAVK